VCQRYDSPPEVRAPLRSIQNEAPLRSIQNEVRRPEKLVGSAKLVWQPHAELPAKIAPGPAPVVHERIAEREPAAPNFASRAISRETTPRLRYPSPDAGRRIAPLPRQRSVERDAPSPRVAVRLHGDVNPVRATSITPRRVSLERHSSVERYGIFEYRAPSIERVRKPSVERPLVRATPLATPRQVSVERAVLATPVVAPVDLPTMVRATPLPRPRNPSLERIVHAAPARQRSVERVVHMCTPPMSPTMSRPTRRVSVERAVTATGVDGRVLSGRAISPAPTTVRAGISPAPAPSRVASAGYLPSGAAVPAIVLCNPVHRAPLPPAAPVSLDVMDVPSPTKAVVRPSISSAVVEPPSPKSQSSESSHGNPEGAYYTVTEQQPGGDDHAADLTVWGPGSHSPSPIMSMLSGSDSISPVAQSSPEMHFVERHCSIPSHGALESVAEEAEEEDERMERGRVAATAAPGTLTVTARVGGGFERITVDVPGNLERISLGGTERSQSTEREVILKGRSSSQEKYEYEVSWPTQPYGRHSTTGSCIPVARRSHSDLRRSPNEGVATSRRT
jgi:hypothetical protein